MNLDKGFANLRESTAIEPREEALQKTLQVSREAWFRQEQDMSMGYLGFLWSQLGYTRKRWWASQGVLLWAAARMLSDMPDDYQRVRCLGVVGCLFVVLIIPELWRNKSSDAMQVEAACLYSLRQIYAARVTLFALVDVFFLTLFCRALLRELSMAPMQVMAQLLLPVSVSACICFFLLCSRRNWGETMTIGACLGWCGLWLLVLLDEERYVRILPQVWAGLFALSLLLLGAGIVRTIRNTNQSWEVTFV